ncbi:MAG: ketoacyl-ACP synthase III [Lachnospiraceae bacterium]|jgi:3-oxoacyl-[acyl-carrier-protein] synthase-3|nr:ketoacyl-ACP synthase III [Lachnospiraceae bacterium]
MEVVFKNKKISGILSVLPETESYFDDEIGNYNFPEKQTKRLKKIMGYNKHRISKDSSTASDFCVEGLNYLLDENLIKKEEIGAIIVVGLSPDYFLPQISNIIHGKCELAQDVLCIDMPQGCCGYLLGLMEAFMLLEHMNKKIVLFNADVLSHKVSKYDRSDYPLIGDVTTISVIENDDDGKEIEFRLFTDGSSRNNLQIPAGGFAMPSTPDTAKMVVMEDGNKRSLDNLHMNGGEVFNFVQREVPPMLEKMLSDLGKDKESFEYFLFHQPNRFMLEKLTDTLNIPYEKVFMNVVENYGNPSGASIPTAIVQNLSEQMVTERKYKCCMSAFGAGLTWGAMFLELGNMSFCRMIETNL